MAVGLILLCRHSVSLDDLGVKNTRLRTSFLSALQAKAVALSAGEFSKTLSRVAAEEEEEEEVASTVSSRVKKRDVPRVCSHVPANTWLPIWTMGCSPSNPTNLAPRSWPPALQVVGPPADLPNKS